jgi:pre-mRNA-processing factor SLU7
MGHNLCRYNQGQEIHMQAAPSQAELLFQQYQKKKAKLVGSTKDSILVGLCTS